MGKEEEKAEEIVSNYQFEIGQIWKRARINALAHRAAMNHYVKYDTISYLSSIITSLLSIFSIILSYILQISLKTADSNTSDLEKTISNIFIKINGKSNILSFSSLTALDWTLLSIIFAFISLLITIISNYLRFSIKSEEHKQTQNSYIYIAQRTRESKKPTITKQELESLYEDLERDFAILKVRGIEPQDKHFNIANKLFGEISTDPVSSNAQSFPTQENIDKK